MYKKMVWLTVVLSMMLFTTTVAGAGDEHFHKEVYRHAERLSNDTLLDRANQYLRMGAMQDSALLCYTIVANRYYSMPSDSAHMHQAVKAMINLGMMYTTYYHDYAKAQTYLLQAQELIDKYGISEAQPYLSFNQANLYQMNWGVMQVEDFDKKMVEAYKKPFWEALALKDWEAMGLAFVSLGTNALEGGLIDDIGKELHIIDTVTVGSKPFLDLRRAKCLSRVIRSWKQKDYDEALSQLDSMTLYVGKAQIEQLTGQLYNKLTKCTLLFKLNRHAEALALLEEVEEAASAHHLHGYLLEVYDKRYTYYQQIGNQALADKNRLLLLEMKDQLLTSDKVTSMETTRFLFELRKMEWQMKKQAYQQRMERRIMWLSVALASLIAIMLAVLWVHYRRIRSKNRLLYEKVRELLASEADRVRLSEQVEQEKNAISAPKYDKSPMQEEDKSDLLHRILMIMETSQEVFSDNFTLDRLTELVGDKRKNVSQVINEKYANNFNGMVSDYRVREACRRMADVEHYGHLTIEGIAQSVGFKSRTNFTSVFKKYTGLTPSAYMRMARENA